MKTLISKILFRLYFFIYRWSGRESALTHFYRQRILTHIPPVPYFRSGIWIGLNPVSFLDWCLLARDGFEKEVLHVVDHALKEGGVLLDIGTNIGYFSLYAASKKGVEVFSFEPSPRELQRLYANIRLNHARNITVFPYACSSSHQTLEFSIAEDANPGANSFVPSQDITYVERQTVVAYPLSDLIAPNNLPRVRLCKIDVEGYEMSVLEGMRTAMASLQKALFSVEINPPLLATAENTPQDLYTFFESFGFHGVHGLDNSIRDEEGKYDEVFYHPEHHGAEEVKTLRTISAP